MIHTDGTPTIANSEALVQSVPDFSLRRDGDLFLVRPDSRPARDWVVYNVIDDETQFFGCWLVVEARYFETLFDAIIDDGFTVA